MEHILEVSGLKKSYASVQAVKGLDFYVEQGKLFAFLGPNGAGKSTTINMLCTFLKPDEGTVLLDGHQLGKEDAVIRSLIGSVFQENLLDPLLTVRENLLCRGQFYHLPHLKESAEKAAKATGAFAFWNRPYEKLSGGQRRRADIARALLNTPKFLFLDEPTTGLDPQTRKSVWETIRALQKESGMTVFLTTHYMEEAANADYVIVIDDGKIAARGTPARLREEYASDLLRLDAENAAAVKTILKTHGLAYEVSGGTLTVRLERTMDALPLLDECREHLRGFEVVNGTMDDAFLGITGKEIRE